MNPSSPSSPSQHSAARYLPALAAVAVVGAVVIAGVAGGLGGDEGDAKPTVTDSSSTTVPPSVGLPPSTQAVVTVSTEAPIVTTRLSQPLGYGSAGDSVLDVQERLAELGFFPGPADGQFGRLTEKAVWAFEKLVMGESRNDVRGIVTDEMWQFMQRPIEIQPRRKNSEGEATASHTEVYLPEQVVIFFVDDKPAIISHMSSGDGQTWEEEVTIDVGEYGNDTDEPIVRGEIGVSVTPGGVFSYDRMVEGLRNSALGGMWDPAYFNYGIAIHGAQNVPLDPASHGCIRMPQAVGEKFHDYISRGDQVFVWDGLKEPEFYAQNPNAAYPRGQLPIFNRIDPDYSTTTTTSTPTSTTVAVTQAPTTAAPRPTNPPATQPPQTRPATVPATNPPPPPTDPPPTPPPTTASSPTTTLPT